MRLLFADLETRAIAPRPDYPPLAAGLALWPRGPGGWRRPRYFAFGHESGNDATAGDAVTAYRGFVRAGFVPVFHHAAFDLAVLEEQLGVARPVEWHDTLLLAFLHDPRDPTFALKPLAEKYLGEPPTERDALVEWLKANVPEARKKPKSALAHIWRAPGDLVRPYALGDVTRTAGLFDKFWAVIGNDRELRRAYDRERRVTPILAAMEARGLLVRTRVLAREVPRVERLLATIEAGLFARLRVPKREREGFAFTSDCLADALERTKKVREWILTKNENRATNAEDLREVCTDRKLVDELEVRSQVATCLQTFMRPWLEAGRANDGRFYARYNQVRQEGVEGGGRGAVTGRLSMSPNFQNIIRADKDARVPKLRDYVWSGARDRVLVQRDYSQQELRITAHYEGGPFLQLYLERPDIDAHEAVRELIRRGVGVDLVRRTVKDLNFGLLYGMGAAKLSRKLGIEVGEARRLTRAHLGALPGIRELRQRLEDDARANRPLYTWGGRRYFCERPRVVDGRLWSFEYKQLNYLIQGSAADCTKQAMINYAATAESVRSPLLLQVHDELLLSAPAGCERAAHRALRAAMLDVDFKVPMLSDGKTGAISWHRMKKTAY